MGKLSKLLRYSAVAGFFSIRCVSDCFSFWSYCIAGVYFLILSISFACSSFLAKLSSSSVFKADFYCFRNSSICLYLSKDFSLSSLYLDIRFFLSSSKCVNSFISFYTFSSFHSFISSKAFRKLSISDICISHCSSKPLC